MTPKHPTKVESFRVGLPRMIARGAKSIFLLIGYGLMFCVLFIWYLFFPPASSNSFRKPQRAPYIPEQRLGGLTSEQVLDAQLDSMYYNQSKDYD